jgi:hypothetical protein
MFNSDVGFSGNLNVKVLKTSPQTKWKVKNALRIPFIVGLLNKYLAKGFTSLTGIPTIISELAVKVRRSNGVWEDYGTVCYRVVTDVGVAFLVDDWDNNGQDISTMNFHGAGTGTTAEAAGDTALVTESTTALNPNNVRATGTRSQPAANQYRSVGTLTFDATAAITEHGLFSDVDVSEGVLWDRSVFSAINVASGDSIQFTYTVTLTSGS